MKATEHLSSRQRSDLLMQHLEAAAKSSENEPSQSQAASAETEYYFGYGVGPNDKPALEAVKTWVNGDERRFDTFTIAEYDRVETASELEDKLQTLRHDYGLDAVMNMAEDTATRNGFLDGYRSDPRVFFTDDAPVDPFTTLRQREMDGGFVEHFHIAANEMDMRLLEPIHPDVNYAFEVGLFDNETVELSAYKFWLEADKLQSDAAVLNLYVGENASRQAQTDQQRLYNLHEQEGLKAALAEAQRMSEAIRLPDTSPSGLFSDGPSDGFTAIESTITEKLSQETAGQPHELQQSSDYNIIAISANGYSRLDILKSWGDNNQEYERLMIAQPDWETAQSNAEAVQKMLDQGDLQDAMTLIEILGVEVGVIDPNRTNPRLFTQGPPDPFITIRERQLNISEMDTEPYTPVTLQLNEGVAWFQEVFDGLPIKLLQPIDATVNYALLLHGADPWTDELAVEKYWRKADGNLGIQAMTLDTFDPDDEKREAQVQQTRDRLLQIYDERGLEAMMHKAELTAIQTGWLDGNRTDPCLFTQGPPDRFETLAQQLEDEINPYWNTGGEKMDAPQPRPEAENPYWRLDTLPVNTPEGEPLGHALHMIVYPGVERDPDTISSPAISEDEPFKMLEMAHFETKATADKFRKEFNGYLVPKVLDGPELALEVARLEGLPAEWKTIEGDGLKAYRNAELTLTHNQADWHPYNPNAERDAQITAEGLTSNPIQQLSKLNESVNNPDTQDWEL